MNERAEQLLATAKRETEAGDKAQDRADAHRWKAAEAMWRANHEEGISIRAIAATIDRAYSQTWEAIQAWQQWGVLGAEIRPSWPQAIAEINPSKSSQAREGRKERAALRDSGLVREAIKSDPRAREAILEAISEPDVVENLDSKELSKVSRATDAEWHKRGQAKVESSKQAFRENVGEELADDLELLQTLQDACGKLFAARRALRDATILYRQVDDLPNQTLPFPHRHGVLDTLTDLEAWIGTVRALLTGASFDEDELAEWLAKDA